MQVPLVFQTNHGFKLYQVGLAFMGIMVGELLAVATNPLWQRIWEHLQKQHEAHGGKPGESEPEFRLPSVVVGAPILTIGLFGFAWTSYSFVSQDWLLS